MAEDGFTLFKQYLQARNAPPKPKVAPQIDILKHDAKPKRLLRRHVRTDISYQPPAFNEDYTGSVCLLHSLTELFPTYIEVLVDAEDLGKLSVCRWHLVRGSRSQELRVMNWRKRYLHTVVMDAPKGMVVDHIFQRTLDNRRGQLRICTVRENNINTRPRTSAFSKYKGVGQSKKSGNWFVHAGPRGGRVFIGGFDSELEAARVYNDLARRLYGSMAYQNPV